MIISNYEEALASIGTRAADIEVAACDLTIKPTDFLRAPCIGFSTVEGLLLARAESIIFE
jgi:hypothetical protein